MFGLKIPARNELTITNRKSLSDPTSTRELPCFDDTAKNWSIGFGAYITEGWCMVLSDIDIVYLGLTYRF
ncbi:hypothetical protein [Colwellia echini]|uniref:Outer membrane protein beta-barrel domain-containing protein n=1 Tax=Colwellia echini TaxID=1982103 RepID=A0ABY3MSQ5_9GAMM|nr:hypothetical protein [Colwellia echini]TYK64179.1 hypothetical protein CWS31_017020 [Colwellia echini]